jgi:hypothetical protein
LGAKLWNLFIINEWFLTFKYWQCNNAGVGF